MQKTHPLRRALAATVLVGTALFGVSPSPVAATDGRPAGVVTIEPCVVLDTTRGARGFSGPLRGGEGIIVDPVADFSTDQGGTGDCGIPKAATAVVLDITAVKPLRPGNLRAFPTGEPATGGVVNFSNLSPNLDNSNAVIIPLSEADELTIEVNAGGSTLDTVDVRLTAIGYLQPGAGLTYHPVNPCAVADSRFANSQWAGRYDGMEERRIRIGGSFNIGQGGGTSNCGVPSTADAALINLVAINPTGAGRIGVHPPSSLDKTSYTGYAEFPNSMNNSNAVIVPMEAGEVDLLADADLASSTDIRVVVLGYLQAGGDSFVPISPCAAFDSRSNKGATGDFVGPLVGGQAITYRVTDSFPSAQGGGNTSCGVPANATSVLMNLVATNPIRGGNLRVSADGVAPEGGVVNFAALSPAMNNSNAIVVPLSFDGEIDVSLNAGTFGLGLPSAGVRGVVLGYFFDETPELGVTIDTPTDFEDVQSPVTIAGVATDDVAVTGVDLTIRDVGTGLLLGFCGIDIYCFISVPSSTVPATLDAAGDPRSPFSFGPVDLEDAGGSGNYTVTAFATDGASTVNDSVTFQTRELSPPEVVMVEPVNGAAHPANLPIRALATDPDGFASAGFVIQDVNTGEYLQKQGTGQIWDDPLIEVPAAFNDAGDVALLITANDSVGRTLRIVSVRVADRTGVSTTIDPGVTFTLVAAS